MPNDDGYTFVKGVLHGPDGKPVDPRAMKARLRAKAATEEE